MGRQHLRRLKELEKENQRLRRAVSDLTPDELLLTEAAKETTEPGACRTLGKHRSTQPKTPQGRADQELLTEDIIALARD